MRSRVQYGRGGGGRHVLLLYRTFHVCVKVSPDFILGNVARLSSDVLAVGDSRPVDMMAPLFWGVKL
jgi:hypothetical protein